jgi:hypothetical protein
MNMKKSLQSTIERRDNEFGNGRRINLFGSMARKRSPTLNTEPVSQPKPYSIYALP